MSGNDIVRRWRPSGPRYRTIDEARIIDLLLLSGWAFEVRREGAAPFVAEAGEALERLVRLGLPHRLSAENTRLFDPVEVVNFAKWMGLTGQDAFWEERFVATGRSLVRWYHPGIQAEGAPPNVASLGARRFTVLLQRRVSLEGHRTGAPLRLRLPLPIEDHALQDLRVGAWEPGATGLEISLFPGRVEARGAVPDEGKVSLAMRCSFTARPIVPVAQATPLDAVEWSRYLRFAEGLIQVTDQVRSLADHLAGACRDPWQVVHRLHRFMLERLACGMVHYDEVHSALAATDWVLQAGWFDCQVGSALLVALCRARDIPARLVGGYLLYPAAPTQHHWAEIWMEDLGWAPFDLLAWDLSMAGRDRDWQGHFAGQLDHRLTTQRLPLVFTGAMTVRLPTAWHMLTRLTSHGTETTFLNLSPESMVYQDVLSVVPDAFEAGMDPVS